MKRWNALLCMSLLLLPLPAAAQGARPVIVVNAFTVSPDSALPYDMNLLQKSILAELKARFTKDDVEFVAEPPDSSLGKAYTVSGTFSNWKPGSTAKRVFVGFVSGREGVDLHFWMTDETGQRVVDRKEKIKAQFIGSAYQGNVGELSHPVADKVGDKLKDTKLFKKPKG